VVKDEMINLVFAVDSILAAVAMSRTTWVIVTGGLLGVVMMRVLTMQVLELVRKYPKLIDGAYLIIAWVGLKLFLEYLHVMKWLELDIPNWFSIGLVLVLFVGSFVYAKRHAEQSAAEAPDGFHFEAVDLQQTGAPPQDRD
jgi:predicted tellurium resistance membrane protein TerC